MYGLSSWLVGGAKGHLLSHVGFNDWSNRVTFHSVSNSVYRKQKGYKYYIIRYIYNMLRLELLPLWPPFSERWKCLEIIFILDIFEMGS